MRYFQLAYYSGAPNMRGTPRWRLPSIRCDLCGQVWGTTGVRVPSLDLSMLPDEERYRWENGVAVSPTEFVEWTEPLRTLVSSSALRPGAALGPLQAPVGPSHGAYAWCGMSSLAVSGLELRSLRAEGLFAGVASALDAKDPAGLCELELLPMVEVRPSQRLPPVCAGCMRPNYRDIEVPVLTRASLATDHIARGYEFTNRIYVSEEFIRFVVHREWRGLQYEEILVE